MASVTTPAQRAYAKTLAGGNKRAYQTLLRQAQRASAQGKAGKQRRSGVKAAEKLAGISKLAPSREVGKAAKYLAAALQPKQYKVIDWDKPGWLTSGYGSIKIEDNGNALFYVDMNAGIAGKYKHYEIMTFDTRQEAMELARLYQKGEGAQAWINMRAKSISVKRREEGDTFTIRKRGKKGDKRNIVKDTATRGGWAVAVESVIPPDDAISEFENDTNTPEYDEEIDDSLFDEDNWDE